VTTTYVLTAREAAARDAAAIAAGIPSRALMRQAGAAAAAEIHRRLPDRAERGCAVFAGPGNNGGDACVIAGALDERGLRVRVCEVVEARTDDARAERALVHDRIALGAPDGHEGVVIDGLLGTGATGEPHGEIAAAVARIRELAAAGASVVALDVPTGLDASSGAGSDSVIADITLTFSSLKRGHLVARDRCGTIVVLDIGLGAFGDPGDAAPTLVDARRVRDHVPRIPVDAHKGTRGRIAIVGGGAGMVGAALLAARAALRSGVGLPRLVVAEESLAIVQGAAHDAIAAVWPANDAEAARTIGEWAHAVVIGPGLGRSHVTRVLVERVLRAWRGPTVLDADALNVFEGDADALGRLLAGRPALLTPHPLEFARLTGLPLERVLAERFDVGLDLARRARATVLLKGVPTVLFSPDGARLVSATGSPTLAVGGSGDVLSGIAATLLAQMGDPLDAGACAAWVHGRAGELARDASGGVRGTTLDDVLDALPGAWRHVPSTAPYPVLAELPAVGADPRRDVTA
jgi:NAD(P)H-hydrate epimerase